MRRVYEVAKEMGKSAAAVVVAMKKAGINKNAVATLTDAEVAKIKANYSNIEAIDKILSN